MMLQLLYAHSTGVFLQGVQEVRLINEKEIIVHLLRSPAPAALQPGIKTSQRPFPAHRCILQHTCTLKPQLLPKDVFSAGLPTFF